MKRNLRKERISFIKTGREPKNLPKGLLMQLPAPWLYVLDDAFGRESVEMLVTVMLKWSPPTRRRIKNYLENYLEGSGKHSYEFAQEIAERLRDHNPQVLRSLFVAKPSLVLWVRQHHKKLVSLLKNDTSVINEVIGNAPSFIRKGCHLSAASTYFRLYQAEGGIFANDYAQMNRRAKEYLEKNYTREKLTALANALAIEQGYSKAPSIRECMKLMQGTKRRWTSKAFIDLMMYIGDGENIARNQGFTVNFPGTIRGDFAASEIVHRQYQLQLQTMEAEKFSDTTEMYVPQGLQLPEKWEAQRIKTAGQMRTIGRQNNHCLGTYVQDRNSLFFHSEGITAQVRYSYGEWSIEQCRGYSNRVNDATETYETKIREEVLPLLLQTEPPDDQDVQGYE